MSHSKSSPSLHFCVQKVEVTYSGYTNTDTHKKSQQILFCISVFFRHYKSNIEFPKLFKWMQTENRKYSMLCQKPHCSVIKKIHNLFFYVITVCQKESNIKDIYRFVCVLFIKGLLVVFFFLLSIFHTSEALVVGRQSFEQVSFIIKRSCSGCLSCSSCRRYTATLVQFSCILSWSLFLFFFTPESILFIYCNQVYPALLVKDNPFSQPVQRRKDDLR